MISRKVKTLLTHPRRVVWKYFGPLWCRLRNIPAPLYGKDYDHHWGYTSFAGKIILDLGADYGSTVHFFLSRGAKKVVAVEGNPDFASKLKGWYGLDRRVTCIERWISSANDLKELLEKYQVDVAKVDIVGAERYLLGVPQKLLCGVDEWLIQSHPLKTASDLMAKFERLGFFTVICLTRPRGVMFYCVKLPVSSKNSTREASMLLKAKEAMKMS